jgi:hypothetical protein
MRQLQQLQGDCKIGEEPGQTLHICCRRRKANNTGDQSSSMALLGLLGSELKDNATRYVALLQHLINLR